MPYHAALDARIKSAATHLECAKCFSRVSFTTLRGTCPCGGTYLVRYELAKVKAGTSLEACWDRGWGIWNWSEVLPVVDSGHRRGLGEGDTPVEPEPSLARVLGVRSVLLKNEGVNPGGSFKARGMAVAVARAKELGCDGLMLPTAGNAGVAAAAYGAYWGLNVTVAFPQDTPLPFIEDATAHGASCHLVPGSIADCGAWLRSKGNPTPDAFSVATLREPYRVEGKKTMGYELVAQNGGKWPDVVIYPTGGGTGIIGMWKAHQEMTELGWLQGPPPRFVVVQSEGCAPIVRAFADGLESAPPWNNPRTYALGLRVPGTLGDHLILEALGRSRGTAVSVSEASIEAAVEEVAFQTGFCPAPEAAATWAAAKTLRDIKWLGKDDTVCLFMTGSGVVGAGGTQSLGGKVKR